ncbi:MAG: MurR/RpiR family transcriptional regulator [Beduini sp.]|uniref:MurR/RpiR family transcriptional regulator n=1 Tax=Beduini sp. TaxID=1922300 RepID=UPI0039A2CF32
MLYSKLPIIFLSTLASEKDGSTNSLIAEFILTHLNDMEAIGIRELAEQCHVAISSISRFCKEIGLQDYNELKTLLTLPDLRFELYSSSPLLEKRIEEYSVKIKESIDQVIKSIQPKQIRQLCQDIQRYHKVALFGLMKAGSVALNLQSDLLMLGKVTYTKISYKQQMEYLKSATQDDLIIIFSYTGAYFDYEFRRLPQSLKCPKLYFVYGGEEPQEEFIETIHFDSLQDQASHPYQLQCIASLIAQEYAYLNKE